MSQEDKNNLTQIVIATLLTAILGVCGWVAVGINSQVEKTARTAETTAKAVAEAQSSQANLTEQVKQLSSLLASVTEVQGQMRIDIAERKANAFTAQDGNNVQLLINGNTALINQNTRDIARNYAEAKRSQDHVAAQIRELERRTRGSK